MVTVGLTWMIMLMWKLIIFVSLDIVWWYSDNSSAGEAHVQYGTMVITAAADTLVPSAISRHTGDHRVSMIFFKDYQVIQILSDVMEI